MRAIHSVEKIQDRNARLALAAMKERLETFARIRGDVLESAITVGDLVSLGLISMDDVQANKLYNPNKPAQPALSAYVVVDSVSSEVIAIKTNDGDNIVDSTGDFVTIESGDSGSIAPPSFITIMTNRGDPIYTISGSVVEIEI